MLCLVSLGAGAGASTAVLPSAALPEPARRPGGSATVSWAAKHRGHRVTATYCVTVLRLADSPGELFLDEAAVGATLGTAEAAGAAFLEERKTGDKLKDVPDFESSDEMLSQVFSASSVVDHEIASVSGQGTKSLNILLEKLVPFFKTYASSDTCDFLKEMVRVLKCGFQTDIRRRRHLALPVIQALFRKVRTLREANLLRRDNPVSLDALPDEVLERVLIFLQPRDVLEVADVGPRWARLALGQPVWKHMRFLRHERSWNQCTMSLALSRAPCLNFLDLHPHRASLPLLEQGSGYWSTDSDSDSSYPLRPKRMNLRPCSPVGLCDIGFWRQPVH